MAGGEPVRIYLLNKDGMSFGGATAAVIGERLIDAFFVLALVPLGIFIFKDKPGLEALSLGLTIGVIVFIAFIILFLYAISRPDKTKSFLIFISKIITRFSKKKDSEIKIISWINHEVDNFSVSMKCFVGKRKKALFLASVVTILFWSTGFMIASMILLGLGLPPFFLESYAAQGLLLIIILLPLTPGSAGVAELGTYALYGVLLTDPASHPLLGVFTILYRFITYHMNLIAGAIFQYRIFKSITSFSMDIIKTDEEKPQCK
jgi:glycosyltransferase 2 family protein